jgi:murein DD-endopeptidase MepM/ murein hydrolase activator NlpD
VWDLCRPRLAWFAIALAIVVGQVLIVVLVAPPAAGAQEPQGGGYVPPVDAPISEPFRPPASPYGPGNRGIEYATAPGSPVRASAAGTVLFAGPVGGALHVTIGHPDGLRTSYSFLVGIAVAAGQRVEQGDHVGTAGDRLHFGVRAGDIYLDPAGLFTGLVVEVELVPTGPGPATAAAEAAALREIVRDLDGPGLLGDALAWLRERARAQLAASPYDAYRRGLHLVDDLAGRLLAPPACSAEPPPEQPAAGQGRVAITVGGLGSTSSDAAVDDLRSEELGYEPGRVLRFSYAGGRTPPPVGDFPDLDARAYGSADTQGDVAVAAGRLADLVENVLASDPDTTVDLYAHSLGGLVTRLTLLDLAERGADLRRLGVVVTLGTPHRGADLATAVNAANTGLVANLGLDLAERELDVGIDPDAPVVHQLAVGSDLVNRLAAAGVPAGVRLVSIAARGDLVVASPSSEVAGGVSVTVPVSGWRAHSAVVGSDAATAEMSRALAGVPPGCEAWTDVVGDVMAGHAVSFLEGHALTAVLASG